MPVNVEVSGTMEAMKILEEYPNKINTATKKAMRAATKNVLVDMKSGAHKKFKPLVKAKFLKKEKNPTLMFGFFGTKGGTSSDNTIPTWFKAYWKNYGTLTKRHPGHSFEFARKRISKGWRGGERPVLFYEKATEGKDEIILAKFAEELLKEAKKIEENG